jgi:ABC-2 family transporter protein
MIWLTWRQHRTEIFLVGGALALIALALVVTGREIADAYQQWGVGACVANPELPNCFDIISRFEDQYGFWASAIPWLNLVPALLAILIGAPLVARELEHGTHRLIWTQSVTRTRWLAAKLGIVLGIGLVVAVVLTAILTWWRTPFDAMGGHMPPDGFDLEGTVSLGYIVYALALAITASTLLRRVVPAMVVTLAGFLAVRLPVEFWLRAHYLPPLTVTASPMQDTSSPGRMDWRLDDGWLDAQGHPQDFSHILSVCTDHGTNLTQTKLSILQCAQDHGWLTYTVYQPADRFWLFQGIETALFVVLALALLGLAIWWVRRRIS